MEGIAVAMLPLSARIGTLALLSLICVGLAAQDVAAPPSSRRPSGSENSSKTPSPQAGPRSAVVFEGICY